MSIYRTHIISRGVRIFFATVFLAFFKSVSSHLRTSPIRRISSVIMLLETVNIFVRDGLNVTTGGRFWENGVFLHPYLIIEIGRSCCQTSQCILTRNKPIWRSDIAKSDSCHIIFHRNYQSKDTVSRYRSKKGRQFAAISL